MVVFLIVLEAWLLIYSRLAIRNGLHIIRYGEEKHRWMVRIEEPLSELVGEPLSKLVGYGYVLSGILTLLGAFWAFITVAMGDGLPVEIFPPLICSIFLLMGSTVIVNLISEINRKLNR